MKPTWLVQSNLIHEFTLLDIQSACKGLSLDCRGVKIIPFTDSPEFLLDPFLEPPSGPIIPYGSTSMIKSFARSKLDKSGFFFNQENLRTSKWIKELGRNVLNYDSQFMTLKEAFGLRGGTYFMKPDNDLKDFVGGIVEAKEIRSFYEKVSAGGFCFTPDIPVVLSSVKSMGLEYRLFMIKDRVIASSSYGFKSLRYDIIPVPEDVKSFAVTCAGTWYPDDVYVVDVCETDEGYKIVEYNCFNASGFYNSSIEDIVREASLYVESKPALEAPLP